MMQVVPVAATAIITLAVFGPVKVVVGLGTGAVILGLDMAMGGGIRLMLGMRAIPSRRGMGVVRIIEGGSCLFLVSGLDGVGKNMYI
jgi:hypothetical protein